MTVMTADPFVPLAGANNFRDAGGLPTTDGGRIRRGLLYRSNRLSKLTEEDHALLAPLGIARIYDLREPHERDRSPTRWPGPAIRTWNDRDHLPPWQQRLLGYSPDEQGVRHFLTDLYAELPGAFAPRIADIARAIGDGEGACVIHCSAGKDRTGVVVGVLLALAGVAQADILAEYSLTNGRLGLAEDQRRAFGELREAGVRSAAAQAVLLSADAAFLETTFATIDADHGGLDAYARDTLGLNDAERTAFRAAMVEPNIRGETT
jgi:protein-tyrosine phosphatase